MSVTDTKKFDGVEVTLDTSHRCDRCKAQAKAYVMLDSGYDLLFCLHHWNKENPETGISNAEKLSAIAALVHVETVEV